MIFLAGTQFGIFAARRWKTLKNQWSGRQDYSARDGPHPFGAALRALTRLTT
jgi:hypothetical protein